jgi:hypothetical protein
VGYVIPFEINSLEMRERSNAVRMRSSTASQRSLDRRCTRVGSARKLYAVWSEEANMD